jgi:hypothetical protein
MKILMRCKINGTTVSVIETEHSIDIEILGSQTKKQYEAIKNYLIEEGFMEEIICGNIPPQSTLLTEQTE